MKKKTSNLHRSIKTAIKRSGDTPKYAEVEVFDLETNSIHPVESASTTRDYIEGSFLPLVSGDEDVEELVRRMYSVAGFEAIRLENNTEVFEMANNGAISEVVLKEISKIVFNDKEEEGIAALAQLLVKGVPDLFVYNVNAYSGLKEMFFVEVKSSNDSLRRSQLKWMMENSEFKRKIAYIDIKFYENTDLNEEEKVN